MILCEVYLVVLEADLPTAEGLCSYQRINIRNSSSEGRFYNPNNYPSLFLFCRALLFKILVYSCKSLFVHCAACGIIHVFMYGMIPKIRKSNNYTKFPLSVIWEWVAMQLRPSPQGIAIPTYVVLPIWHMRPLRFQINESGI